MSKIKAADFYYGAVLSMLFNSHINPALIQGDEDRQVYDLTTNHGEFRLYIKYRADRKDIKTDNYKSWLFTLTENDKMDLLTYINSDYDLVVALVCGVSYLAESEIAFLTKDEIKTIVELQKTSITISRRKNERAFRIPIGGGRANSLQIKANRFEELFHLGND